MTNAVNVAALGSGPAFSAYATVGTSLTGGVFTKVSFDTEEFDTNSTFSSSRFTPTVAGYYQINAGVTLQNNTSAGYGTIAIYKNGSELRQGTSYASTVSSPMSVVTSLVYCNGSTDYIEIYGIPVSTITSGTGVYASWFNGFLARAA